jgi:hypothetical protein
MIDVGSDTVSAPTLATHRAMAGAPVGRDPSVVAVRHRCFGYTCCQADVRRPADVFARMLFREAA